jgi:hypothetical protein
MRRRANPKGANPREIIDFQYGTLMLQRGHLAAIRSRALQKKGPAEAGPVPVGGSGAAKAGGECR